MKKAWKAAMLATFAVGTLVVAGCGSDSTSGSGDLPQVGVAIYKFDDTFMSVYVRVSMLMLKAKLKLIS